MINKFKQAQTPCHGSCRPRHISVVKPKEIWRPRHPAHGVRKSKSRLPAKMLFERKRFTYSLRRLPQNGHSYFAECIDEPREPLERPLTENKTFLHSAKIPEASKCKKDSFQTSPRKKTNCWKMLCTAQKSRGTKKMPQVNMLKHRTKSTAQTFQKSQLNAGDTKNALLSRRQECYAIQEFLDL